MIGLAKVNDAVPARVLEHLRRTYRLLDTAFALAAPLTERFDVVSTGDDAVGLERLLGYLYRLPRRRNPRAQRPDQYEVPVDDIADPVHHHTVNMVGPAS